LQVLITIREAAEILSLKSRNSIYRKINSGELKTEVGSDGPMIERDGLEQRWANITRKRSDSPKPKTAAALPPPQVQPVQRSDEPPDYSESRARSEFEKANLLELERKQKEGLLLPREDVERAQAAALAISKTRLLGVPSTAKQRIPHLSLDEVEILTGLIREALEELAGWEVAA
jgi:hypothetical protein